MFQYVCIVLQLAERVSMRLKGKTALVTGAAGDIGRTIAKRFSEEGATVILSDINEPGCQRTAEEIRASGKEAGMMIADVSKEEDTLALFDRVKKDYRRLDILANIAGGDAEIQIPLEEISNETITRNIDINLKSCIFCCREASNIMIEQEYGKIVNMCSMTYRGSPMQFSYSAAKGGIYAFTRTLALTLGMYNITANGIAPALVEVDAITSTMDPEMWEAVKADVSSRYPLGRIGQPEDVANCALFLASDESSFITGQIIEVSGGARL